MQYTLFSAVIMNALIIMPAYAFQCGVSAEKYGMLSEGQPEGPAILLNSDKLALDPDRTHQWLGASGWIDVTEAKVVNGTAILTGNIGFRQDKEDRISHSLEMDWDCDYGSYIESTNEMPREIRQKIADTIKTKLKDPYSIRSAALSVMQPNDKHAPFLVCVQFNAKNSLGGYAGVTNWPYFYRDGVSEPWVSIHHKQNSCLMGTNKLQFTELGQSD